MSLRVAFIGCVEFSHAALSCLMTLPGIEIAAVVTREASTINADFRSLAGLAGEIGCPVQFVTGNDQAAMAEFLGAARPDVIFCFGWSYMLKREVLDLAPHGIIGYHPAALPENRGRHPIIWALALGLDHTASTFFRMAEEADAGDIVSQVGIAITDQDDAASLYRRLISTALEQIPVFTTALAAGTLTSRPQDHSRANCWRKRSAKDGEIDWRMAPQAIYNLVRALTRPYVGAHAMVGGQAAKVWACRVGPDAAANLEPGRVLAVDGHEITVKCWQGSVVLTEHDFPALPCVGGCL